MAVAKTSIIQKIVRQCPGPVANCVQNRRRSIVIGQQNERVVTRIVLIGPGIAVGNGVLLCRSVVDLQIALVHVLSRGRGVRRVVLDLVVDSRGIEA